MPRVKKPERKSAVLEAYKTYEGALKQFVWRILLNNSGHNVDDIIQEAFLLAYKAEKKKAIYHPKSFLFQITKNVAINQLRQKNRRPTDYLGDFEPSDVLVNEWTPEHETMAQQKLELHCAAVGALPPQCRKVYLMRKVYSMSYKEIAEMLGITVSTVETHLEKGFARCKAYVEKRTGEEGIRHNHSVERRKI